MPSFGALSVFSIDGDLTPASAKTTRFNQFGSDGVGFVVGAKRQPPSKLVSTSFSDDRTAQDDLKSQAASLVGTVLDITRDVGGGAVVVSDCFVESVDVTKSEAATGLPGSATFVTELTWTVSVPETW